MGNFSSLPIVCKINTNQLSIPDYILREILSYLDVYYAKQNYQINQNPLYLSLVCSYWMINIIPRAFKVITFTPYNYKQIMQFPQTLYRLQNDQFLDSSSQLSSLSPSPFMFEKFTIHFFDSRDRPTTLVSYLFKSKTNNSNRIENDWFLKNINTIMQLYPNLKRLHLYNIDYIESFNLLDTNFFRSKRIESLRMKLTHSPRPLTTPDTTISSFNVTTSDLPKHRFIFFDVKKLHLIDISDCLVNTTVCIFGVEDLSIIYNQYPFLIYRTDSLKKLKLCRNILSLLNRYDTPSIKISEQLTHLTLEFTYNIGKMKGQLTKSLVNLRYLSFFGICGNAHNETGNAFDIIFQEVHHHVNRLETLKLKGVSLNGMKMIELLDEMKVLKKLTFSNWIDGTPRLIINYLEQTPPPTLKHLSISSPSSLLLPSIFSDLCKMISNNTTLTKLSMKYVEKEDLFEYSLAIQDNSTLKVLKMDNNISSYIPDKDILIFNK